MRRFSKILTVLLTVCLVFGVMMSVFASAEETNQLNVTNATYNRNVDFEDGTVGLWENYRGGYAKLEVVTAANGNKYYSFTSNTAQAADATNNIQLGWRGSANAYDSATGDNGSTLGYAYATIDFDIGTDRYVYTDASGIKHTVDADGNPITSVDQIPEGCAYDLAYSTQRSYFTVRGLKSGGGWGELHQQFSYIMAKDSNGWYIYNNQNTSSKKIYLSGEIGVFDHVTFVLKNTYNDEGSLTGAYFYTYVNGEYMCSTSISSGYTDFRLQKLTISEETYKVGKSDKFAMAYDNLAINYYAKDTAATASLNSFFAGSYSSNAITSCDSVVYNANYVTPNPERFATINGNKYYAMKAAFDQLKAGSVVTINADVNGCNITKLVNNFTVVATNGAKFSFAPGSNYEVTETVDGDTTTYICVISGSPAGDGWLNITGDAHNHANAYGTTGGGANHGAATWNGDTTGYVQISDSSYFKGVGYGRNSATGTYEIYQNPSVAVTHPNNGVSIYWYMSPYRHIAAGWNAADISGYEYVIADFDFGTNRYVYTDSEGVQHTAYAGSVPEGATDVKPAYAAGSAVSVTYNGYTGTPSKYTEGRYSTNFSVNIVYNSANGLYYASSNGSYDENDILLSNKVGEFDHVSFVFDVANKKIVAFVNGQYIRETTYNASWDVVNVVGTALYAPPAIKNTDTMAMAVDNNAINWYKEAANTSTGIDAFMKGDYKNGKLYNCDDVLYNENYIPHASYVTVGPYRVYLPGLINEKIAALKNDEKVITSISLYDICPTADKIYIQLNDGATFTLSLEADMYTYKDLGNGLYEIKKLEEDALVKINVVNRAGEVIDNFYLAPNVKISAPAFNLDEFVLETLTAYDLEGWYVTVGGVEMLATSYSYSDIKDAPETITVYPKFTESKIGATYVIYTVSESGYKQIVGNVSDYDTMDNLLANVSAAPTGSTVVLLYEGEYDIGGNNYFTIGAGKTVNFDLNGRKLLHSFGSTSDYGAKMITVGEGATFNLYSSVAGGEIYQARYHASSQGGQVFAMGVINTQGVHEATINVYGENLKVIGGSLLYCQGSNATNASSSIGDGKEITMNVYGGYYYTGLRNAYATFTTETPDVNVNISDDATFVSINDSVYTIFATRSAGIMQVDAKDSTFIGLHPNGSIGRIFGAALTDGSSAYFEDCTIVANSTAVNKKVVIGEGCVVAGMDASAVTFDADYANGSDFSFSVTHPKLYMYMNTNSNSYEYKPMIMDEESGKYYLNPVFYKDAANSWITEEKTASTYFTTVAEDVAAAKTITYLDTKGNVATTAKWLVGSTVPTKISSEVVEGNWYNVQYKYNSITVTDNANLSPVVGDMLTSGSIGGKIANATLSSGMALNIYLPKEEGVTITEVKVGDVVLAVTEVDVIYDGESKTYYVFSWASAAADFSVATATVSYTVNSEQYGFENKTATATVELDMVRYATIVSSTFDHETEESILIVNMMQYKEAVATALALSAGEEYVQTEATAAFFAAHQDCYCGEVSIEEPADDYYDIDALIDAGLKGATFTMDNIGEIKLVFEPQDETNTDLVITVKYSDLRRTYTLVATYNAEAKCYITPGIPAAYIDNAFTITVGDEEAVGIYSLYAYIEEMSENEDENEYYIYVANALAEYAAAAEAYKYITVDEVE